MPRKTDKIPLKDPFLKKSAKLLPCQKEMVIYWREIKGLSFNKIALIFKVSKRTIQFICDPEKQKENLQRRKERGGSAQYYNKEANTSQIRVHRQYKNSILPK